eukprot:811696-Rhodomonas_salina.1
MDASQRRNLPCASTSAHAPTRLLLASKQFVGDKKRARLRKSLRARTGGGGSPAHLLVGIQRLQTDRTRHTLPVIAHKR